MDFREACIAFRSRALISLMGPRLDTGRRDPLAGRMALIKLFSLLCSTTDSCAGDHRFVLSKVLPEDGAGLF